MMDGMYLPLQETTILCPNCGNQNLHHENVEVLERNREDDRYGIHVFVDGEKVLVDSDASTRNPSRRRDGIRISFWCEHCPFPSSLLIYQHKGETFIRWEQGPQP